jgi:chemotaxis protein methyltransferase CheR
LGEDAGRESPGILKDLDCPEFLRLYLPRLRLRWAGFRKVHRQVCRRLSRRMSELGLCGFFAYKDYLEHHSEELRVLDSICGITISRFYRDRGVFDVLCSDVLPSLAKDVLSKRGSEVACWSAGCCSGEEAYTLQILWKLRVLPVLRRDLPLRIVATDIKREVLDRAREGCFTESSLRDLPEELVRLAFTRSGTFFTVREPFKENIEFAEQDMRRQLPEGFFHLILCRNVVLTYFEEALQREILQRILERLHHGGVFVAGIHESLPKGVNGFSPYGKIPCIYKKIAC